MLFVLLYFFAIFLFILDSLLCSTANDLLQGSPNRALKHTVTYDNNIICQKQVSGQIKERIFCKIWHLFYFGC